MDDDNAKWSALVAGACLGGFCAVVLVMFILDACEKYGLIR